MRAFIAARLASAASRVIAREHPHVVAVTGSVGKSSAKQAIGAVLRRKFATRMSLKNLNTEIGVPLTILGLPEGKSSAMRWLGILWSAFWRSLSHQAGYPSVLVLEMAADRKGDIKKLARIAKPDIAVVTAVGESHAEFLGSKEEIMREKRGLVEALGKDGVAVLNRDDAMVWGMREKCKGTVMSYGFDVEAQIRASEASINASCDPKTGACGMSFKLTDGNATVPVFLPNVLGRHAAYAALAAAAVGVAKGMNLVEIADGLAEYDAPAGRMRFVQGIKDTVIIDDTYNAAPLSVLAALAALKELEIPESAKRIAVLGDMLELGKESPEQHAQIGRSAAADGVDLLVVVGERMGEAKAAALGEGMPEGMIAHFATAEEAGRFVQNKMKQGDAVLVKGSRGMKMEIVVKEIMEDPLTAADVLVGDHDEWRV
jgi:UDP-N-acetylmuramoyl-tripeptide--D-alanyl-D-alanine ligase